MKDKELYQKSLQKILQSSEFRDSPTYKNLLTYLVDCHISGETPKETSIAIDLLHRDSSFNPSEDTIVRVYVHELRKRLKIYYQTEGKKDKIRLEIPKGGYELKFSNIKKITGTKSYLFFYFLCIILLVSIIINVVLFQKNASHKNRDLSKICSSKIWSDILLNDKPILIVLGDVFFFTEKNRNNQHPRVIRDENINSIEDLELYKTQNRDPSLEISPLTRHTYFIEYCAFSLVNLVPILKSSQKPVSLRLCSQLNVDDLRTHNIVYVGFIKCLGSLKLYFEKSQFNITSNYSFSFFDSEKDSLLEYSSGNPINYQMDYGFVIKFLGPDNNQIFLLTGTRLPGTLGVVTKVTNIESIREIEKNFNHKYSEFPQNFEILYEVFGLNREFIQSDILYFQSTDTLVQSIWTTKLE